MKLDPTLAVLFSSLAVACLRPCAAQGKWVPLDRSYFDFYALGGKKCEGNTKVKASVWLPTTRYGHFLRYSSSKTNPATSYRVGWHENTVEANKNPKGSYKYGANYNVKKRGAWNYWVSFELEQGSDAECKAYVVLGDCLPSGHDETGFWGITIIERGKVNGNVSTEWDNTNKHWNIKKIGPGKATWYGRFGCSNEPKSVG